MHTESTVIFMTARYSRLALPPRIYPPIPSRVLSRRLFATSAGNGAGNGIGI